MAEAKTELRSIEETPEHDAIVAAAEYIGIEPEKFAAGLDMWKRWSTPQATPPAQASEREAMQQAIDAAINARDKKYANAAAQKKGILDAAMKAWSAARTTPPNADVVEHVDTLLKQIVMAAQSAERVLASIQQASPLPSEEAESVCHEDDGCPTEMAVLKRFWRKHNSGGNND